jgi:BASS family bile acid:Na+ symporter
MLGMGLVLSTDDFREVFRRPRALGVGLGLQLLAVPLIAFSVSRALPLEVGIVAGLALVAAVPGGAFSNVVTYLAGGNIALSISLTAITTVGALATTPMLLGIMLAENMPPDFVMPVGRVATDITLALLLPLFLGMLVGARLEVQLRRRLARAAILASLAVVAAMVAGGAGSGRLDVTAYGWTPPLVVIGIAFCFTQVADLTTRLAGLGDRDRAAVSIEVTLRNMNLALLVKASIFPAVAGVADPIGDGMFFVALVYGGVQMVACTAPVWKYRRVLAATA